jgi:hypothetical protein
MTTFRVEGLTSLLRVVDAQPREVSRDVRGALRKVAVPVRDDATRLFVEKVSPNPKLTRYGISVRKAGTITVEQRIKKSGVVARRRSHFAERQKGRAMTPALEQNADVVEREFRGVLADLERRWGRGGV